VLSMGIVSWPGRKNNENVGIEVSGTLFCPVISLQIFSEEDSRFCTFLLREVYKAGKIYKNL